MSLSIYKVSEYETTHEREQYRSLKELLIKEFANKEGFHLLIANPNLDGCELDALFIKRDAVIVLEFKNYGGKITATENEWLNNDTIIIKGGYNKSPFKQVSQNKWAVINFLKDWLPDCGNVHHVSGTVVFAKDITVENRLPEKVENWFKITDMSHIVDILNDMTSEINFSESNIKKLIRTMMLHIDEDKLEYDSSQAITEEKEPMVKEKQTVATQKIAPGIDDIKFRDIEGIQTLIENAGFEIKYNIPKAPIAGKEATEEEMKELKFSKLAMEYISNKKIKPYKHQYEAFKKIVEKSNICVATSTGSGKSLIFQIAALEILSKNPDAKILAIYPMKALGNQQEKIWTEINANISTGRIDGDVGGLDRRDEILKNSQIVTMTPDVVHTYLLGQISREAVRNFVKNLNLVIVDEIHLYNGVLGSNSAYLFRRLNACNHLLKGKTLQYITASATIATPEEHSKNITGVEFQLIGKELDTSPKSEGTILFLDTKNRDIHLQTADLLRSLIDNIPESRIITFVNSRTQAGRIAIAGSDEIARQQDDEEKEELKNYDRLEDRNIYSYKSGMKDEDRRKIQDALENGTIRGVVSTSALEVGIDIPGLNIDVLVGAPYSSTSLSQRMGRVGRGRNNNHHLIILINDNSLQSKVLFNNPMRLFGLPMQEPALYLDNKRLLAIQVLHFANDNGEYIACGGKRNSFTVADFFPEKFSKMCTEIIVEYQIPDGDDYRKLLQYLRGNISQYVYGLRSFDDQFQLFRVNNRGLRVGRIPFDTISYAQVMREAYPEALYHSGHVHYRIIGIPNYGEQSIEAIIENVRGVRLKYTRPFPKSVNVYPLVKESQRYATCCCGEAKLFNLDILEITSIGGLKEYIVFDNGYTHNLEPKRYKKIFKRDDFFTKGVVIFHPILNEGEVQNSYISKLLYEAFLLDNAFERADINYENGVTRKDFDGVIKGDKFIVIYDLIVDGLNICARMLDEKVLRKAFSRLKEIIEKKEYIGLIDENTLHQETIDAITVLCQCFEENDLADVASTYGNVDKVIAKDSFGEYEYEDEGEKVTIRVMINDVREVGGILMYETEPRINGERRTNISAVSPIRGESQVGEYFYGDVINVRLYN